MNTWKEIETRWQKAGTGILYQKEALIVFETLREQEHRIVALRGLLEKLIVHTGKYDKATNRVIDDLTGRPRRIS